MRKYWTETECGGGEAIPDVQSAENKGATFQTPARIKIPTNNKHKTLITCD